MPALSLTDSFTDSNRTLEPRRGILPAFPAYPPIRGPRRVWIPHLPEELKFASSNPVEFQDQLIIRQDDPNAGRFAGRLAGGGRRADIYGNKRYGSGYPNATTEGVEGRNLPFFFYPVSYGRDPGHGSTYIFNQEYGPPDDGRRPGGPLHYFTIRPAESLTAGPYPEIPPITLFLVADKPTLKYIKPALIWCCSKHNYNGWSGAEKVTVSRLRRFKGPAQDPNGPAPEQAVGYYRGSSVVLSLLGYNNTAQSIDYTPQNPIGLMDTPLPPAASSLFFHCINETLGKSIPLVVDTDAVPYKANAAPSMATPQPVFATSLTLVLVIWHMFFW